MIDKLKIWQVRVYALRCGHTGMRRLRRRDARGDAAFVASRKGCSC